MLTIQPLRSHGADWHRVVSDRISSREQPLHNIQTIEPCLSNHRHFKRYTTCPTSPPYKSRISAICIAVSTMISDLQHNLFPAVYERFPPMLQGVEQALVLHLCPLLRMLQVSRAQVFVHLHTELRLVALLPVLNGTRSPPASLTHGNGYKCRKSTSIGTHQCFGIKPFADVHNIILKSFTQALKKLLD